MSPYVFLLYYHFKVEYTKKAQRTVSLLYYFAIGGTSITKSLNGNVAHG